MVVVIVVVVLLLVVMVVVVVVVMVVVMVVGHSQYVLAPFLAMHWFRNFTQTYLQYLKRWV